MSFIVPQIILNNVILYVMPILFKTVIFFQSFFMLECLIIYSLNYSLCPSLKYLHLSHILLKTEQAKDSEVVQAIWGSI